MGGGGTQSRSLTGADLRYPQDTARHRNRPTNTLAAIPLLATMKQFETVDNPFHSQAMIVALKRYPVPTLQNK